MKNVGSKALVSVIASLLALPVHADVLPGKAGAANERIGPAAKGEPKSYQIEVEGDCGNQVCAINFGKKAKPRAIRLITCGFVSGGDPQFGVVVFVDQGVQFYMPIASVAPIMGAQVSIFEFRFDFEVPADTQFQVLLQGPEATEGACTATGTIG